MCNSNRLCIDYLLNLNTKNFDMDDYYEIFEFAERKHDEITLNFAKNKIDEEYRRIMNSK